MLSVTTFATRTPPTLCALTCAIAMTSCGLVSIGGGTGANDPVPSGTIVGQGTLSSQNGSTVSGTATAYSSASGSYIVRLQGFTMTAAPSGLFITVTASDGTKPLNASLRSTTGNQNYAVTYTGVGTLSQVTILVPGGLNQSYAQALLTSP